MTQDPTDKAREQVNKLLDFFTEPNQGEKYLKDLEDDLVTLIDKAVKQKEADVRHNIANQAPGCSHSLQSEEEHQLWCGFVNNIWLHWAIENNAKSQLEGVKL